LQLRVELNFCNFVPISIDFVPISIDFVPISVNLVPIRICAKSMMIQMEL